MDRLTLKANAPTTLITQIAGTSYTVQPGDKNAVLGFTASSPITVNLPPNLPPGFEVELLQMGGGQITAQGAHMVSPQGEFFTPVQFASLTCRIVSNASGAAAVWLVSSGGAAGQGGGSSSATVTSYTTIRGTTFQPTANLITLSDKYLGGMFVPAPTPQRDDGGLCIHDASGKAWVRLYEGRVNAKWFYSLPGGHLGDGSGAQITSTDVINNPQWVGLPDGSGMYPPGTYWDYVCLQEWLYCCTGDRSAPPAVFNGSITHAILSVSAWISGPHSLQIGQTIAGQNIPTGTIVCYDFGDGVRYGVGVPQITGSLGTDDAPCTATPSGALFHCYITNPNGALLVSNQLVAGTTTLPQVGDLINAPPGGVPPYGVILPGCYILAPTAGPGAVGNWIVGVCPQDIPSEQMQVIGGAVWNKQNGNYNLNRAGFCPNGNFDTNQMLASCVEGADLDFGQRAAANIRWHGTMGNQTLTPAQYNLAGPAVLFNPISYSNVSSLSVSDSSAGCTGWLVSVDYNPNQLPFVAGGNVFANTFTDWNIGGTGPKTFGGLALSKAGGGAQGDTQVLTNFVIGSVMHGCLIGGDNVVGVLFVTGNFIGFYGRGIWNAGAGCFSTVNTLFEGSPYNYYVYPMVNQITMDGADYYSAEVGTENSTSIGTRSESSVAAIDTNYSLELHAYTIANASFGSYPAAGFSVPSHQHLGYSLYASGNNFDLVMAVDDSGPDWRMGVADAATGTVITFTQKLTGGIAGGVLTVDALDPVYGGGMNIGDVITGPGVPAGVTVTGFGYGVGGQAGQYTLAGAAGVTVPDGTALTAQPNWTPNQWTGIGVIAIRYGSNGYSAWVGIVSNTANTVTTNSGFGKNLNYPLGYKIQGATGTAPINWLGVPLANFGRSSSVLKNSPGYCWTVKAGSNWISANASPAPAGSYAMVCGAGRFMLQQPNGPGDIAPLIGKVGAQNPGGNFTGSILYSTLTVTTTPTHPLMPGQAVTGAQNTRVIQQLTGPAGGAGTYAVDTPQIYPQSAQFGGTVAGNVLTVTNGYQGVPKAGDYLIGQTGTVPQGTQLVGLLSGTAGATGSTWQLSAAVNSGYDWMYTGNPNANPVAMASVTAFSLVHPFDGKPMVSAISAVDITGYWGQPIWDGNVAWIPIDFDVVWGIKQLQGGNGMGVGRAAKCGQMDSEDPPSTLLSPTSTFVRDAAPMEHRRLLPSGPGPSIAPGAQFASGNFTVPVGNNSTSVGGTKSMYFLVQGNMTLNLPQVAGNMELDLDLIFEQWGTSGFVITWGTSSTGGNAPIRALNPSITLGVANQVTMVKMKWLGSLWGTTGAWMVMSVQGPL